MIFPGKHRTKKNIRGFTQEVVAMYSKSGKNIWVLVLFLLAGIVLGGFIGELVTNLADAVDFLSFLKVLNYSRDFGWPQPFTQDLGVISFTIGLQIRFSVWGIIGMAIALLVYRKM